MMKHSGLNVRAKFKLLTDKIKACTDRLSYLKLIELKQYLYNTQLIRR